MEVVNYIDECTIVASQIGNQNFLFKNRDKTYRGKYKLIHELFDDVEICYASDDTEWVEGMNEYGIGFILAFLKNKDKFSTIEKGDIKSFSFLNKEYDGEFYDHKVEDFKNILSCKTLDSACKILEKNKWNGNYFVGDSKRIFSLEIYDGTVIKKELDLGLNKDNEPNIYVRTNYGLDTIGGYSISSRYNIDGSSAYLRRYQSLNSLKGFESYIDVIKRMSFQYYDEKSPLNVFKTTDLDLTVAQYFMNLQEKLFIYIHSNANKNFFGIDDKLPQYHIPKIKIILKNREEILSDNDWDLFKNYI